MFLGPLTAVLKTELAYHQNKASYREVQVFTVRSFQHVEVNAKGMWAEPWWCQLHCMTSVLSEIVMFIKPLLDLLEEGGRSTFLFQRPLMVKSFLPLPLTVPSVQRPCLTEPGLPYLQQFHYCYVLWFRHEGRCCCHIGYLWWDIPYPSLQNQIWF